jgi:nitrogen regulatory protein P-II 1
MKKIEAIIRKSKFEEVKKALNEINVHFFTFSDVKVFGTPPNSNAREPYDDGSIERMKLEMIVADYMTRKIIEKISRAARTGEMGDGKVMVYRIEQTYRIRTGETDLEAL